MTPAKIAPGTGSEMETREMRKRAVYCPEPCSPDEIRWYGAELVDGCIKILDGLIDRRRKEMMPLDSTSKDRPRNG